VAESKPDDEAVHLLLGEESEENSFLKGALHKAEEHLRYISRTGQEMFWEWNLGTDRHWSSESAATLFKFNEKDPVRTFQELLEHAHPEDSDRICVESEMVVKEGKSLWLSEFRLRKGDGSITTVAVRAFLLCDPDGAPRSMVGSFMDISTSKIFEARCAEMQELATLGALCKGIVQKLNNVFTPIMSSGEMLQKDQFLPESQQELLSRVHKCGVRGAALVEKLSDYAESEPRLPEDVDLKRVLDEALDLMQEILPKNIELKSNVAESPGKIHCRALRLKQTLMALLEVAVHNIPDGGHIVISATHVDVDAQFAISRRNATPGKHIKLTFACYLADETGEDGHGVSGVTGMDARKALTTLLESLMESVSDSGGFIDFNTSLARMKQYDYYLPSEQQERVIDGENEDLKRYQGEGELILVVEDDDSVRDVTGKLLEQNGYRVETAENGALAINKFIENQASIAMVVMDLDMPVMDGVTASRLLRQLKPEVKILPATGSARKQEEIQEFLFGDEAHQNWFLPKPYTTLDLLKALHEMRKGRPRIEPALSECLMIAEAWRRRPRRDPARHDDLHAAIIHDGRLHPQEVCPSG